jgi:hypothetical protein
MCLKYGVNIKCNGCNFDNRYVLMLFSKITFCRIMKDMRVCRFEKPDVAPGV